MSKKQYFAFNLRIDPRERCGESEGSTPNSLTKREADIADTAARLTRFNSLCKTAHDAIATLRHEFHHSPSMLTPELLQQLRSMSEILEHNIERTRHSKVSDYI